MATERPQETANTPAATSTPARFDAALLASGKISAEDLRKVRRLAVEKGERIDRMLIELGFLSEDDMLPVLADFHGVELVEADAIPDSPPVLEDLSVEYMRAARILPLRAEDDRIVLAMADPGDGAVIENVELVTGKRVEPVLVRARDLAERFERLFGGVEEPETGPEGIEVLKEDEEDVEHLRDLASEAPVIRLVNQILSRAVEQRASDIHVEPFENELRVRYRIDGVLHDVDAPPRSLTAAVISRIKLMAKLNIAERRLPQDGRIKIRLVGREIDLRVSSLPTLYGESVVLRILDRSSIVVDLTRLGMPDDTLETFTHLISQPHGLLLVTGPTGSGKTTTLYGALDKINSPDKKIITIEDPVEYQLRGVNQIHVRSQIGLTFASGLRSIVRQDPDVIMVGEIRDAETAEIAIQAALTGHLVFSTLHTNDAAGAVSRLLDMGVEDYLLASSLLGVLAQRLVRQLCPHCREPVEAGPDLLRELRAGANGDEPTVFREVGCRECAGTGFRGRTGIYELLQVDDQIRKLILARTPADQIKATAIERGMRTLRDDGWRKVSAGVTTVAEVLRVTQDE
ncbi:MAG: type II secretion system protein GspE [Deltaproteobacteria bacterium]|nr:MAG: type II secretion system protein GspE [Deltaproteobacteria bacterium]